MNDGGDCRTALLTPGLLTTVNEARTIPGQRARTTALYRSRVIPYKSTEKNIIYFFIFFLSTKQVKSF